MAEDAKEAKEKPTADQAPPKKTFPVKWVIIGILALILIGGGVFFALSYFSESGSSPNGDATATKVDKPEKVEAGVMYPMEPFIVNLLDKGGKRYLKVRMELELPNENLTNELTRRKAQLRDTILLLLTSKSFDNVNRLEGKFQLRSELMFRINQVLQTGKIQALYFTEFVVQ